MAALQPVCYFKSKSKSTQFRQTIFISSYFYNYQNIIKNQAHTCSETLFGQIKLKSKQSLIEQYLIYQLLHLVMSPSAHLQLLILFETPNPQNSIIERKIEKFQSLNNN